MVNKILEVYFTRLNHHRPVFIRSSFEKNLDALYKGTAAHDPGFVCSVYLVLALGTLSELNHRVSGAEKDGHAFGSGAALKKFMPPDWPSQDEFFDLALAVKPELRVTISSLQALILLHWYLYTEVCSHPAAQRVHLTSSSDRVGLSGVWSAAWSDWPSNLGCITTLTPSRLMTTPIL